MKGYRINTPVNCHDVDYNGIARASAVLRYMQSAAEAQLGDNGMSYNELYRRGRAFILSKIRLEIDKPLWAETPLGVITFPCESRGYSFLRCYAIEQDGVTVARAASMWALLDVSNRELVRVNDFELGLDTLPSLDMTINRFKLPEVMRDMGDYRVHYGDVDRNMHMNNTKYPDMYSSFLDLKGKMISSITVNYMNEARMGERLNVMMGNDGEDFFFRTGREDGKVNSEAKICLKTI